MNNAVETLRSYAERAVRINDADHIEGNVMKAHKMLMALAGLNPGYDAKIDRALAGDEPLELGDDIAKAIHYPECWDTAVYPTISVAIRELAGCAGCSECNSKLKQLPLNEKDLRFVIGLIEAKSEAISEPPIDKELYEFSYPKYGQHIVAMREKNKFGRELFDAVKLFAQDGSLAEYERVKDEAAAFAKEFVARFNK